MFDLPIFHTIDIAANCYFYYNNYLIELAITNDYFLSNQCQEYAMCLFTSKKIIYRCKYKTIHTEDRTRNNKGVTFIRIKKLGKSYDLKFYNF